MKHYIIQKVKDNEFFMFNRERPETDKARLDTFGVLRWTAHFAREGYLVSFVDLSTMEERVVCAQKPSVVV